VISLLQSRAVFFVCSFWSLRERAHTWSRAISSSVHYARAESKRNAESLSTRATPTLLLSISLSLFLLWGMQRALKMYVCVCVCVKRLKCGISKQDFLRARVCFLSYECNSFPDENIKQQSGFKQIHMTRTYLAVWLHVHVPRNLTFEQLFSFLYLFSFSVLQINSSFLSKLTLVLPHDTTRSLNSRAIYGAIGWIISLIEALTEFLLICWSLNLQ